MCNFLSGIIALDPPRMICTDLFHHEETVKTAKLKPEQYREWEWTEDDAGESLSIRMPPGKTNVPLRTWMLAAYPTRRACLLDCVRQVNAVGGSLYLSGCDLTGIALPQSVGGSLDLRGCDLTGIALPQSVGGSLYLSGCDLTGIALPQSVGGSMDLSGCDLTGIALPQSVGGPLDLSGCDLTGIALPHQLTTKVIR